MEAELLNQTTVVQSHLNTLCKNLRAQNIPYTDKKGRDRLQELSEQHSLKEYELEFMYLQATITRMVIKARFGDVIGYYPISDGVVGSFELKTT